MWIGVVLLLAACGAGQPEVDSAALAADTTRIAQEYVANGNLDQARAAIDALEVANPHQYLVLRAEEAISANNDPQATSALVKLAVDMRLSSGSIQSYATQNGLIAVAPTPEPAPTLDFGPPTATPAPALAVAAAAPAAPLTTTQVLTGSAALTSTGAANTAPTGPSVSSDALVNVRGGPGIEFAVVGTLNPGQSAPITGKSSAADWWQITFSGSQSGWVLGQLVTASGDTAAVAVPANIPTPPPTATPAPIADVPTVAPAPPSDATPTADPAATPAPPTASPTDKPYFKVISSRMWSKAENGDCTGQHLLRINVIDANGVRLNGVRLKGIYTGEIIVTGSQGKGDGVIEYDLYGTGEGFTVIQNDDGREADSDRAEGFTTQSRDISQDLLIAGGYCTNDADCQIFYDSWGCNGHHSWEATFQRNY